jgi:predicted hydrocarbon binding protein
MPVRDRNGSPIDLTKGLTDLPPDRASKLLGAALSADTVSGVLRLYDVPCVIVRPEAIVSIQKQLELTVGGSAKGILYLSGERSARDGMNPLDTEVPPGAPLSLANARRITESAALLGWGRIEISLFDPVGSRLLLTVTNSPLARAYGSSKKPVCHFLSGWIAGLGRSLLDREVLCEEAACAAQGHGRCEFELRPTTMP